MDDLPDELLSDELLLSALDAHGLLGRQSLQQPQQQPQPAATSTSTPTRSSTSSSSSSSSTPNSVTSSTPISPPILIDVEDSDEAFARQLQAEEEQLSEYHRRQHEQHHHHRLLLQQQQLLRQQQLQRQYQQQQQQQRRNYPRHRRSVHGRHEPLDDAGAIGWFMPPAVLQALSPIHQHHALLHGHALRAYHSDPWIDEHDDVGEPASGSRASRRRNVRERVSERLPLHALPSIDADTRATAAQPPPVSTSIRSQ